MSVVWTMDSLIAALQCCSSIKLRGNCLKEVWQKFLGFLTQAPGLLRPNPSWTCFYVNRWFWVSALSPLNPECAGFVMSTQKKWINCLAFSWNVAFPVSWGNVAINIITGIIVQWAITQYMWGTRPAISKPTFIVGFSDTVCISM